MSNQNNNVGQKRKERDLKTEAVENVFLDQIADLLIRQIEARV